jgi:hypothetical protein
MLRDSTGKVRLLAINLIRTYLATGVGMLATGWLDPLMKCANSMFLGILDMFQASTVKIYSQSLTQDAQLLRLDIETLRDTMFLLRLDTHHRTSKNSALRISEDLVSGYNLYIQSEEAIILIFL